MHVDRITPAVNQSPDIAVGGIDEAGRGPLAGPVVAAVVVLAGARTIEGVRDSKQLTAARREELAVRIRAEALDWGLGIATPAEIDELNILQATLLAMSRAVAALNHVPPLLEVDGNQLPRLAGYRGRLAAVIGGDRLRPAISAASILAKVWRDRALLELHAEFPGYGFDRHKGYGTPAHRAALQEIGPCPAHRRSFAPVREALARQGLLSR